MTEKSREWEEYFNEHCELPAGAIIDLFGEIEKLERERGVLSDITASRIIELEDRIAVLEKALREAEDDLDE